MRVLAPRNIVSQYLAIPFFSRKPVNAQTRTDHTTPSVKELPAPDGAGKSPKEDEDGWIGRHPRLEIERYSAPL
ncbi:uncharacterized protein METZ01_LOCUS322962 [marine metagenome]|uniref:Uncharacterized protein n=1 Tax=marine metagenome TaxID=408172 RepID=A0A382PBJ7_9ZZZZ